jgi:predicted phosphodiesterase
MKHALMGNYDLDVGSRSDDCGGAHTSKEEAEVLSKHSIAWTNGHTTEEYKLYLRQLNDQIPLQFGGLCIQLVHGSPRKINEYLYEQRPDATKERLLDLAQAEVLVCVHTHIPFHRILSSGRHVVNAGSVGKPTDGNPEARYVVLEAMDSSVVVKFGRVPEDIERAGKTDFCLRKLILTAFIFLGGRRNE